MPQLATYDLEFHSGLHLGTRGLNLEESSPYVPADTLFSSLVHAWRYTGGDAAAWCSAFLADPPFLITSAFPRAGQVRFYPMPVDLSHWFEAQTLHLRGKELKRIHFISEGVLRALLDGRLLDDLLFPQDEYKEPSAGMALQGGAFWMLFEERKQLPQSLNLPGKWYALRRSSVYSSQQTPRVTIDRITSSSTLFHIGRTQFSPGCGLWFGIEWRDPDQEIGGLPFRDAFLKALAWLQDEGLGGDRAAGYGAFGWRAGSTVMLPDSPGDRPALLLSRYLPSNVELEQGVLGGDRVAYRLARIGGYLHSPDAIAQPRRQITFITEGSTVQDFGAPAGILVDLRPAAGGRHFPHPVYRYGFALFAGIGEKEHTGG